MVRCHTNTHYITQYIPADYNVAARLCSLPRPTSLPTTVPAVGDLDVNLPKVLCGVYFPITPTTRIIGEIWETDNTHQLKRHSRYLPNVIFVKFPRDSKNCC